MSLKYKIEDVLYVMVFLWGIITIVTHSAIVHNGFMYWVFNGLEVIMIIIALLCFCARITTYKMPVTSITMILIMIFGAYLSFVKSGSDDLLITSLWIIAVIGLDFQKTVSFYFKGELIGFVSVLVCCYAGLITNKSFIAIREGGSVVRYYMGFVHSNAFAGLAMQMTALYLYLNFKRIKSYHFLLLLFFNYWVYTLAYSRTGFFLSLVLIIGVFVNKYAERLFFTRILEWTIKNMARILLILGVGGSLLLAVNYEKLRSVSLLQSYDSLLSRIRFISDALKNYELTLFGQAINFVNSSTYSQVSIKAAVIDNAYVYLLLQFGIVNAVVIIVGYISVIKYVCEKKDNILILCTVIFIVFGFNEKYFVELTYNFTLFLLSCVIGRRLKRWR